MSTLHIYRGIPASGKSTAALEWVTEDPATRVRVNRDDIRFMTFGKYWGVDEDYVTKVQTDLLVAAFKAKRDAVLDATNLNAKNLKSVLALAEKWGQGVEFVDFPIELHVAIERDKNRERSVGEDVIKSFYDRYTRNGKFPPVPKLPEPHPFNPYVPGRNPVVSFDIDGTLAHHNARDIYDCSRAYEDSVDANLHVVFCDAAEQYKIIFMTGRSEKFRGVTTRWIEEKVLRNAKIPYGYELFMRADGDERNDGIVKSEMVDQHVSNVYDIVLHYDDRQRVVDALRAKGIKVAQVMPGDF